MDKKLILKRAFNTRSRRHKKMNVKPKDFNNFMTINGFYTNSEVPKANVKNIDAKDFLSQNGINLNEPIQTPKNKLIEEPVNALNFLLNNGIDVIGNETEDEDSEYDSDAIDEKK